MVSLYVDAAVEATSRTSLQLAELGHIFGSGIADRELATIHREVAGQARRSIVASFGQTVSRRGGPSGYRSSATGVMRRWSGGRLKAALSRGDYLLPSATGIVLDVGPLDRAAVQWARLNFGAGPRGRGSLPPVMARFGDLVLAVGLGQTARPGFVVPAGYWEAGEGNRVGPDPGRRGMDAFYVSSRARSPEGRLRRGEPRSATAPRQSRVVSRGIAGRNFIDRGTERIAIELPRRYLLLYRELGERGMTRVRPASITVTTTPGRRRAPDTSVVAGQIQSRLGRRSLT
jgi:hypothetical protein